MSKGIFIDLDGTLLNNQKEISDFDKKAIAKAQSCGYKIFLVTGKSAQNAVAYYNELKLDTIFITSMGQVLSKPNDSGFNPILNLSSYAQLKDAITAIGKCTEIKNYLFETFDGQVHAAKCEGSNLVRLIADGKASFCMVDENLQDIIGSYVEVEKISEDELKAIVTKLNLEFEDKIEFSYWLTGDELPIIHIKPDFIGKSVAIHMVSEIEGVDYIISFGNGWNDRNMLRQSNEGYAMLNALEPVKKYASGVTEYDNNNSGVGKQIIKILENEQQ